jgi:hypothetical protein
MQLYTFLLLTPVTISSTNCSLWYRSDGLLPSAVGRLAGKERQLYRCSCTVSWKLLIFAQFTDFRLFTSYRLYVLMFRGFFLPSSSRLILKSADIQLKEISVSLRLKHSTFLQSVGKSRLPRCKNFEGRNFKSSLKTCPIRRCSTVNGDIMCFDANNTRSGMFASADTRSVYTDGNIKMI